MTEWLKTLIKLQAGELEWNAYAAGTAAYVFP
jgi:hypothetical protein